MENIRVEEGDYVEEGQVIAALDLETIASLREDIDDARVKIQDAQDSIEDLNNPYTALDVVLAEEKIVKARVALRDAEDALEDLLTLPDLEDELADAEWNVEKAKLDIAKAEDVPRQAQRRRRPQRRGTGRSQNRLLRSLPRQRPAGPLPPRRRMGDQTGRRQ